MKLSDYIKNNDIELTEEQVEQLDLALGIERKNKRFKLEIGDPYYYISPLGNVEEEEVWCPKYNNNLYMLGNCFRTREEAVFEREKKKLLVELQNFADENNDKIDWYDENCKKYFISYCFIEKELDFDFCYRYSEINNIYYSNENIVNEVIKKFGDRIKKYLFNVEDDKILKEGKEI